MTTDGQAESEIEVIARKCGRIIYAYVAGAFCQSEMFLQLDHLVPPGRENEAVLVLPEATQSQLRKMYLNRDLTRDGYYSKYRMHIAIFDSSIVGKDSV